MQYNQHKREPNQTIRHSGTDERKANVLLNEVPISPSSCTLPTVSCVAQNNDCRRVSANSVGLIRT